MDVILSLIMLVAGIVIMIKGELKLTQKSVSKGVPARLAGLILVSALPLSIVVSMVYAVMSIQNGKPLLGESFDGLLSYAVMVVLALLSVLVARIGIQAPAQESQA